MMTNKMNTNGIDIIFHSVASIIQSKENYQIFTTDDLNNTSNKIIDEDVEEEPKAVDSVILVQTYHQNEE